HRVSIAAAPEMVAWVAVTHAELDMFFTVCRAACEEALAAAPRLQSGAWCRFCPARPICPLHTQPLLDLSRFVTPAVLRAAPDKAAYLRALAAGLDLVEAVKDLRTALHDQAKRALENGDEIPRYPLSAGRAERHWRDEIAAQIALLSLGFDHDDIIEAEMMRSPKQLELRAKARGLKIPSELIGSRRSGVSLVKRENVRVPVLGRGEIARTFSEALKAILKGDKASVTATPMATAITPTTMANTTKGPRASKLPPRQREVRPPPWQRSKRRSPASTQHPASAAPVCR